MVLRPELKYYILCFHSNHLCRIVPHTPPSRKQQTVAEPELHRNRRFDSPENSLELLLCLLPLRPLQNYTALKRKGDVKNLVGSLRPLQNYTALKLDKIATQSHFCLRPLQNYTALKPMNFMVCQALLFETPTKLHCSQTRGLYIPSSRPFETPTKLHCSQTTANMTNSSKSLRPLQNYTALKRSW